MRLAASERSTWTEGQLASCAKRVYEAHPQLVQTVTERVTDPKRGTIERGRIVRADTAADVEQTTREALAQCRRLTPQDPTAGLGPRRQDGSSVYEPVCSVRYTAAPVLEAERKVMGFAEARGAVPFTRPEALQAAGEKHRVDGTVRPALSPTRARPSPPCSDRTAGCGSWSGPRGPARRRSWRPSSTPTTPEASP